MKPWSKRKVAGQNAATADLTNDTLSDARQNWNLFAEIPEEILFRKIATGLRHYPAAVLFLGLDCMEKRDFVQRIRGQYFSDWRYYIVTQADGYYRESEPMIQTLQAEPTNVIIEFRELAGTYDALASESCVLQLHNHTDIHPVVGVNVVSSYPAWDDVLSSRNYHERDLADGWKYIHENPPDASKFDYFCEQCLNR